MEQEAKTEQETKPEITINEVEIAKISLKPGEILSVTFKSNDLDRETLTIIKEKLNKLFPNNHVLVFGIAPEDGIVYEVLTPPDTNMKCSSCSDCSFGNCQQGVSDDEA